MLGWAIGQPTSFQSDQQRPIARAVTILGGKCSLVGGRVVLVGWVEGGLELFPIDANKVFPNHI